MTGSSVRPTPDPERTNPGPRERFFLPKLVPPRRRGDTIRRERLLAALNRAIEHDVIVVSAPAGYGKSTLAVDWVTDAGLPVAWLSLDRQDTDPVVLLTNLIGAVRQAFPTALDGLLGRLDLGGGPRSAPALAAEFSSAVQEEIDELFALVIDDLHVLDDAPEAAAVLDTLIRMLPMNLRPYLLSRTWPALGSLARLTTQRRTLTITARELVFTTEEAEALLEQSGIADPVARGEVARRADGWAAALAVMADHYDAARGLFGGADLGFVLTQFIDQEVIDRLTPDEEAVLTACALLPIFDREFVQDMTHLEHTGATLFALSQTNHLLTRLDDRDGGEWYRMHPLLREHLLQRLQRQRPSELLELRRNAAAACARRGRTADAVDLSIEAQDWPGVVRELYDLREPLYQRGEWSTLIEWIDRLPSSVLSQEIDLAITRARLASKLNRWHECLRRLDAIEAQTLDIEQQVRTRLYRGVALRALGNISDAMEHCRAARAMAQETLPDSSALFAELNLEEGRTLRRAGRLEPARERLGAAATAFAALYDDHRAAEAHDALGATLYNLGWLAESMAEYTIAQRGWRLLAEPEAQIATMNNMAVVQYMLGETETARDAFKAVIERARALGQRRYEAYGTEGLAGVERDFGHLDNAIPLYTIAIHEAQDVDDPALIMAATYGLAMCYRERGDHAHARALLDHGLRSAEQSGALMQQARFGNGVGATLISEQAYPEAIAALELAISRAESTGARRELTIGRFLLAVACYHGRRRTRASDELAAVHALTEQLGYDQFLLVEARQAAEVLEYAAARRIGGEYFRNMSNRLRRAPAEVVEQTSVFRVRAEAFGGPRVTVDGRSVAELEWRSERSKEMFFYLLQQGRPLRKEEIALQLWPDASPKQLNSVFHSTLYRLRRAIHPNVVVQSSGGYEVNPEFDISYDVREFEKHAADADHADPGSPAWREGLARAVGLYRGPFAMSFESEWADDARRRYEEIYLSCSLALSAAALRRGDTAEAVTMAEAVIAVDPLNEDATFAAMQAHVQHGHLDLATRAYRHLHDAMRDELGTSPSRRLQTLYQRVLSGEALDADDR